MYLRKVRFFEIYITFYYLIFFLIYQYGLGWIAWIMRMLAAICKQADNNSCLSAVGSAGWRKRNGHLACRTLLRNGESSR